MRFADTGLDAGTVSDLLIIAADLGITSLHSSQEYASFEIFCQALVIARRARPDWRPVHIVKVAEPGFDEDRFDPGRFFSMLDGYRSMLRIDQVDVVQWMIRHDLKNHGRRVAILDRDSGTIGEVRQQANEAGSIGSLIAFPYHPSEVEAEMEAAWCDGFALYLNPFEVPDIGLLNRCLVDGRGVVGIRPLAAGQVLAEDRTSSGDDWRSLADSRAAAALRFALLHPAIATTVVSTSSSAHLAELAQASDQVPSAAKFARMAGAANSA